MQNTRLIIVCGLPGEGKTTVARLLAKKINAVHLQNDVIRKELFETQTYGNEETEQVYNELCRRTEKLISMSSVVCDATFASARHRARMQELAMRKNIPYMLIRVTCPEEMVEARLSKRSGDASGAGFSEFLKKKSMWEDIRTPHVVVDSSNNLEEEIARLLFLEK